MKKYLPLLIYPALVVLFDQLSKHWVLQNIALQHAKPVWDGFFDLVHFRNRGVAFSMLDDLQASGHQWFFYAATLIAVAALFAIYRKTPEGDRKTQIPLALILGGALGNLLDRLQLDEVVDFLYFHWHDQVADFTLLGRHFHFLLAWPAFNVADSAITCGALFLAVKVLFLDPKSGVKG